MNYEQVRKILVADPRIGSWGLYDSLFAGGSCFIKDAASLAHQLESAGTHAHLVRGILDANVFQRDHFFSRAETEANFEWAGKTVAFWVWPINKIPMICVIPARWESFNNYLVPGVAKIKAYDPAGMNEAKKYFNPEKNPLNTKIEYATDVASALQESNAVIICTDWPQFKTAAVSILVNTKPPYLIMDGRRIINSDYPELVSKGYDVIAVGSPFLKNNGGRHINK